MVSHVHYARNKINKRQPFNHLVDLIASGKDITEITFHRQTLQSSLPHHQNQYIAVLSLAGKGCPHYQPRPTKPFKIDRKLEGKAHVYNRYPKTGEKNRKKKRKKKKAEVAAGSKKISLVVKSI